MKTTIDIDNDIFKRLCAVTKTQKKGDAIRMAVDGFLREETKKALLALRSSGVIADDYDHKAWRKQERKFRVK